MQALQQLAECTSASPYQPGCSHSFFRDLLMVAEADRRAGTNEDVALVVERSQVVLVSSGPAIRIFEEVGSQTMTVRVRAHRDFAVIVKNPAAVAKVTGLTAPSGF
jgi:hypothetical protein